METWKSSESLKRLQHLVINDYEVCGTLEICDYCNRCPGQSFIEHGNPLKASSSNCRIATARMELAKSLLMGIDPLEGLSVIEKLSSHHKIIQEIVSNKSIINYRNKEITF